MHETLFYEVIPLVSQMPQESLQSSKFLSKSDAVFAPLQLFSIRHLRRAFIKLQKVWNRLRGREEEILKNVSRLAPSVRRTEKEKTNSQQRPEK